MAPVRPRPFFWDSLLRGLRFCYLMWGGMLLGSLGLYSRYRLPDVIWSWPDLARFLLGPWVRGLMLGIGLAMVVGALLEVWELVDRLLVRFLHESDH